MTAQSKQERMDRNDKILKLFEQGLPYEVLMQRFGIKKQTVTDALKYARERRAKAK